MTRKWALTASLAALIAATSFAPHALSQDQKAGERAAKAEQSKNSGTMERADRDMRAVLEQLQQLGAKPIATLSVEEARKQPSPADAVKALMEKRGKEKPSAKLSTENVTYPAASGEQPARVYIPEAKGQKGEGQQGLPVIVYYHGGGWVIADLDTYEASAQALARKANAIVVSVEYRHAPEHKFPAAHEDSFAAYKWVLENAEKWGGDPQRVAVAGESAGGNLAINMAIKARDEKVQMPVHMLLVYPVAGTDMTTPSYKENANAMPLSKDAMAWFVEKVIADPADKQNPMLDLVGKADLGNLPDATVITAEIDPLMSEGRALARKLREAGSEVEYQNYEGAAHEFFGMAPVVRDAERAQEFAARELRDAFESPRAATGAGQGSAGKDRGAERDTDKRK